MCYKWVESVFRHMYGIFSQKKEGIIQTGQNATLFIQPVTAPPSDRKNCGVQPQTNQRDITATTS